MKPSLSSEEYAFQQSGSTVVLGRIQRLNIGIRVAAEQSDTGTKKEIGGLLSLSIPPKTQMPSTLFPLLNFLSPNFDSSVSTVTRASNWYGLFLQNDTANNMQEVVEIDHCTIGYARFVQYKLLRTLVCPEINNFSNNRY